MDTNWIKTEDKTYVYYTLETSKGKIHIQEKKKDSFIKDIRASFYPMDSKTGISFGLFRWVSSAKEYSLKYVDEYVSWDNFISSPKPFTKGGI